MLFLEKQSHERNNIYHREKEKVGGEWRGECHAAAPKFVIKISISDCSDIQNAAKRIEKLAQAELQLFYS